MKKLFCITTLSLSVLGSLSGCLQERPSDKPPIHINPNMDSQPRFKAYRENKFFSDRSDMRTPVPGTLAVGRLNEDSRTYQGKDEQGRWVKVSPVAMNLELLNRGQERYNIYCSPCHSKVGDGTGVVVRRGMLKPTSFHDVRIRTAEDGYLFDVMSNGIRNMPSYKHQVSVADRWAIVGYIRALQLSQQAPANTIPGDVLMQMKGK